MRNARALRALFCVLVLSALTAASASPASALTGYYHCTNKPPNQWCDGRANGTYDGLHSWDWNEGWDPIWNGTVVMCQRLYRPSDGHVPAGSSCAYNYASASYGNNPCICYDAEIAQSSGGNRSIYGMAIAN